MEQLGGLANPRHSRRRQVNETRQRENFSARSFGHVAEDEDVVEFCLMNYLSLDQAAV
jgi:7-keto-8-aminopelargonate synthetase-like enzyme